jgi:hypothetical protein
MAERDFSEVERLKPSYQPCLHPPRLSGNAHGIRGHLCETSASRIAGNLPNYDCGLALKAAERGPGCSLHPPLLSSLYVAVIIQRSVASGVDIALDNERVEIKV